MTVRRLLLLAFLSGTCQYAVAQPSPLTQRDSIDLLLKLGHAQLKQTPFEAKKILLRASRYAGEEKYDKGLARAHYLLGQASVRTNAGASALEDFLFAAAIYERLNESSEAGLCYNALASTHLLLNQFPEAISYLDKAQVLFKGDSALLVRALHTRGALYIHSKELDKALEMFGIVQAFAQREGNLALLSSALNNIALVWGEKKVYASSLTYYEKSLALARSVNDPAAITLGLVNLAGVHANLENYRSTGPLLREAIRMAQLHTNPTLYTRALLDLSYALHKSDSLQESEQYALKALEVIRANQVNTMLPVCYTRLSEIYRETKRPDLALQYERKSNAYKDSLLTRERQVIISLAESNNATAFARSRRLPQAAVIFISGALVVVALTGFLLKKKKTTASANKLSTQAMDAATPQESNPARNDFESIEVVNGEGIKLLLVEDILYLQKEKNGYYAFTGHGKYRTHQNIGAIEERLPESFFRINRQVIINIKYMDNYSFWEHHKYILRLKDSKKTEFTISRPRLREMKETFKAFSGGRQGSEY